jgi:hypothetical protein
MILCSDAGKHLAGDDLVDSNVVEAPKATQWN